MTGELNGQFKNAVSMSSSLLGQALRDEAKADEFAIDAFFRSVGAMIDPFRQLIGESLDAHRAMTAISGAMAESRCADCCNARSVTAVPGPACRWTLTNGAADLRTQNSDGHCLREIRQLFNLAVQVATQAYHEATGHAPAQSLQLSTAHGGKNDILKCGVNAVTEEFSLVQRRVSMTLHADALELTDFATLPYLFLHEIVAHGFCGVAIADKRSIVSVEFHDGMMDCVAHSLLSRLRGTGSEPLGDYGPAYGSQAEDVRGRRYDCGPGCDANAAAWKDGRAAYHALLAIFEVASHRAGIDVRAQAVANSRANADGLLIALNSLQDFSHVERAKFVEALQLKFVRGTTSGQGQCLIDEQDLIEEVATYFISRDARHVAAEIMKPRKVQQIFV
ncbi:MAG: hypothetical protein DI587_11130 [Variovorax paradoxus]|nr:MAG: hypothetical protein DI583_11130 [Variovorax paradoxus]PZQ11003.1 MAG: hypothetical protein DI587_11130 [Variovorax paradoxus]